jgi:excinuclease ABC subunit A
VSQGWIRLRGVRVHNLKDIDLDLPRGKLVTFCGVSGSGKTSLALDTLYAEGQRRYIESFSAYTRQFLQRLDKPDCESIEGIPPAVAVTRGAGARSGRSIVATATELADYLRLLFAKLATLHCPTCQQRVVVDTPQSASDRIVEAFASGPLRRVMVGFPISWRDPVDLAAQLAQRQQEGFVRWIVGEKTFHLADDRRALADAITHAQSAIAIVDRLQTSARATRFAESIGTAFDQGDGVAFLLIEESEAIAGTGAVIDGGWWQRDQISAHRRCLGCGTAYPPPEPRLFSFNSPVGACPTCEGFGDVVDFSWDLVVPDPTKTIRQGAIAPWNTPAYRHEYEELLALADDYDVPLDVPFSQLNDAARQRIYDGVEERSFGGLKGFFAWLERKKYKMHIRVFLSRWRSYRRCDTCGGKRLRTESLAYRVAGLDLAQWLSLEVDQAAEKLGQLALDARGEQIGEEIIGSINARLRYLHDVGLGYLQLDRTLRTLSGGEAQRVALTGALGSSLVNMLYVLDEPTSGLHPDDVDRLIHSIVGLKTRGNTVISVEHDEKVIRASDHVVEIGPTAGAGGGRIVFEGTANELIASSKSLTGDYMAGRRGNLVQERTRRKPRGMIRLTGARGNNLKNIEVEFPLGLLCLVTGVSGSGKSTLVDETLYGALCKRKRRAASALPYDDVFGDGQIDEVMLVDQSPISKSPRSNPVTYIKAFDAIRTVFAETVDARTHNYTAGHFSFNSAEGRCEACEGDGVLQIDMQFLADIYMRCGTCKGTRYRKEILGIRYRDHNIAEVLEMTVRQAIGFFRGHSKVIQRLKPLADVGLDYLQLGQAANTLSSGESQRLKLAGFLATTSKRRTLFILDEPTSGLHFSDIVQLIDCFDALLTAGHSLIVVAHNRQLMQAADWIIDLGPGAAQHGGRVVASGTPESISRCRESRTGRVLCELFGQRAQQAIDP